MPQIQPCYLDFHGGLHLGTHGVNLEETAATIPSDTLFAALLDMWDRLGGSVEALVADFPSSDQPEADPPFLITSAMPYAGNVRFFPMPVDLGRLFSSEILEHRAKDLKRIAWLSENLLRRALQREILDSWLFPMDPAEAPQKGVALQNGVLWLTVDEVELLPQSLRTLRKPTAPEDPRGLRALRSRSLWASGPTPRVTIDRIASSSSLFHVGRTTFAAGCGLWFGVSWRRPDARIADGGPTVREAFLTALGALQDDGLGGERTSGHGAFEFRTDEPFELPDRGADQLGYLLSRYHPRPDEAVGALTDPRSAYRLVSLSGWLRSLQAPAQRRKRIRLVSEGSLVCPPREPAGDLANVAPGYQGQSGLPHPVYRAGLAFVIGWPSQEASHA